jgi:hypothetical protein
VTILLRKRSRTVPPRSMPSVSDVLSLPLVDLRVQIARAKLVHDSTAAAAVKQADLVVTRSSAVLLRELASVLGEDLCNATSTFNASLLDTSMWSQPGSAATTRRAPAVLLPFAAVRSALLASVSRLTATSGVEKRGSGSDDDVTSLVSLLRAATACAESTVNTCIALTLAAGAAQRQESRQTSVGVQGLSLSHMQLLLIGLPVSATEVRECTLGAARDVRDRFGRGLSLSCWNLLL